MQDCLFSSISCATTYATPSHRFAPSSRATICRRARSRSGLDQLARRRELILGQPDVRVPPEALRKDPGGLDRRRVVQVPDREERADRKPPAPASAAGVVLWIADDLDD